MMKSILFLFALFAIQVDSFALAAEKLGDCKSITDRMCYSRGPLIISQGVSVEIKTASDKKVDFPLTAKAREHLLDTLIEDSIDRYCPNKKCPCEEDVKYITFKGDSAGIDKINAIELRKAKAHKCISIDSTDLVRRPDYVYASPAIISTSIFYMDYCRNCNGGCHGDEVFATYDTTTGHQYKVKDIVERKNLPALSKAIREGSIKTYNLPAIQESNSTQDQKNEELARLEQLMKNDNAPSVAQRDIYVENGKVFVNSIGFILSCADGTFHPVEVPPQFIKPDFLKLIQVKAE